MKWVVWGGTRKLNCVLVMVIVEGGEGGMEMKEEEEEEEEQQHPFQDDHVDFTN